MAGIDNLVCFPENKIILKFILTLCSCCAQSLEKWEFWRELVSEFIIRMVFLPEVMLVMSVLCGLP